MAYNTKYKLDVKSLLSDSTAMIMTTIRAMSEGAAMALGEDGGVGEATPWYEHEDELRDFSKKYPQKLFSLTGVGEDGEVWRKYFVNGKVQTEKVESVIADFDPEKLE